MEEKEMSRTEISPENLDLVNGGKLLGETVRYCPFCKEAHEVQIVDGFVKYLGSRYTMYYCYESGTRNSYFIETKDGYFNPGRKFLKITG